MTERGQKTRKRILAEAIEAISEGQISAGILVKRLEISKANLFHHFGSMSALIREAFVYLSDAIVHDLTEVEEETLEHYLKKVGTELLRYIKEHPKFSRAMMFYFSKAASDPEIKCLVSQFIERSQSLVMTRLKKFGVERSKREAIALLILINLDGFSLYRLCLEEPEKLSVTWDVFAEACSRVASR